MVEGVVGSEFFHVATVTAVRRSHWQAYGRGGFRERERGEYGSASDFEGGERARGPQIYALAVMANVIFPHTLVKVRCRGRLRGRRRRVATRARARQSGGGWGVRGGLARPLVNSVSSQYRDIGLKLAV